MLTTKTRKELRSALEVEKKRLEEELARFSKRDPRLAGDFDTQNVNFGGTTTDRDVDADTNEVEEFEKLTAVEEALELRLKEVNEALARIDTKDYGACTKCKKSIAPDRLRANPAATTCLRC